MSIANRVLFPAVVLLGIGLAALIAIEGMTIWLGERARFYFDELVAARDIRSAAVELRSALQTAEASQRGFLITGNQIYLAPFSTAKAKGEEEMSRLNRLLAGDAEAQPLLRRLSAVLREKFAEMDNTIALQRDRRDEEAVAVVRTNRGKALVDEANVFLSGIIRTADARLTASIAEQTENALLLRRVAIFGGVVILLVVGLVFAIIWRYARTLGVAYDELADLNADLERRVAARTADLTRANDEIQRFAYIVTHDLRAPLVNIMGFTSEIEAGAASLRAAIERPGADAAVVEEARAAANVDLPEALGFIRSSTRKMDALINAILKLSREGRRELRLERVDLAMAVEGAVAAVRHQITEAGGTVETRIEADAVWTDRMALDQVLGNLLDNAVKYRAAGRPLRIAIGARTLSEAQVEIAVADNGRGIAAADHERVFEPFRRTGAQDQPGEGIGLTYVRTILRNLGGDIGLTSDMNVGSTFRIVLPRQPAEGRP